MTFAGLTELADHHGKQAEMYLAWSHLAAEAEDAEATAAHLANHKQHDTWSKDVRILADAFVTAFPELNHGPNTPGDDAVFSG